MVILAVLLAGVRLINITPYVVLSGSMEPVYPVGSMIYIKAAEPEEVEAGEVITFSVDGGLIATHRVIEINEQERCFITKGDANDVADAPVPFDRMIGKALFCIPRLGRLSDWIAQPPGMYIVVCFVLAALVMMFLPDLLDAADAADKRDQEKK